MPKMCNEFSQRDKPGSILQTVIVSLPYVHVGKLFLKFDVGCLRFEVSSF